MKLGAALSRAVLFLLASSSIAAQAGDFETQYGPPGRYDGPGPFPGYYGGYLYGYLPGPRLPPPSDERILCRRIFLADRYRFEGGAFVHVPVTSRHCRAIHQPQHRFRAAGPVYKR